MKGFEQDKYGCWTASVNEGVIYDKITLTVSVHGDSIILEQEGDEPEDPDIVIIGSREEAQQIVEHLQTWIDSK